MARLKELSIILLSCMTFCAAFVGGGRATTQADDPVIAKALHSLFMTNSIIIHPGLDTELECYAPLRDSAGSDEFLSRTEYIDFVNLSSKNAFPVTNFLDLPPLLISTYNNLICIYCTSFLFEGSQCCTSASAQVNVTGVATSNPAGPQKTFVLEVCSQVVGVIDTLIATPAPTNEPTALPTPVPTPISSPTVSPNTATPTKTPVDTPTVAPNTVTPTVAPNTLAPTKTPVDTPTVAPNTVTPTVAPNTVTPTVAPNTVAPTETPVDTPTVSPVITPTISPSVTPTVQKVPPTIPPRDPPTIPPVVKPTITPVVTPTVPPTNKPTIPGSINSDVTTTFSVASQGITKQQMDANTELTNNLILVINELVTEVEADVGNGRRIRSSSRRLAFSVRDTATLTSSADVVCESGKGNSTSTCMSFAFNVPLTIILETEDVARERFLTRFKKLVNDGRLAALMAVKAMPFDPYVPTKETVNQPTTTPAARATATATDSSPDTTGLIIGVVCSAAILALSGVFLFVRRRNQLAKDEDELEFAVTPSAYAKSNKQDSFDGKPNYGQAGVSANSLVPVVPVQDFATLSEDENQYDKDDDDLKPNYIGQEESLESSSNAGSSGWSSSAGMSSLNTASVDSMDIAYGASLAAIGATSGLHNRYEQDRQDASRKFIPVARADEYQDDNDDHSSIESHSLVGSFENKNPSQVDSIPLPTVSRTDLDTAIEAGDWAAVGATAALLAQTSDSLSYRSSERSTTSASASGLSGLTKSSISTLDANRAAELDQLVDAGDWEGVVLAAAKFETSTDTEDKTLVSNSQSTEDRLSYKSPTDTSIGDSYGSTSESASHARKREEIRSEVEALVRRVVPDEIDNVDEMMLQFRGREEELVETLRTMQERSIAQRAREAVHRSAKREARLSARAKDSRNLGLPPIGPSAPASSQPSAISGTSSDLLGAALGAAALSGAITSSSEGVTSSSKEFRSTESSSGFSDPNFNATQYAGVSKISSTTSGTATTGAEVSTNGTSTDFVTSTDTSSSLSHLQNNKFPHRTALEMAIETGDWEAVGHAAAMLSDGSVTTTTSTDDNISSCSSAFTDSRQSYGDEPDYSRRTKQLDRLIDKGDWSGVVAAASRFSAADHDRKSSKEVTSSEGSTYSLDKKPIAQAAAAGSIGTDSLEENSTKQGWKARLFGSKRSMSSQEGATKSGESESNSSIPISKKEEDDALQQAELWMAIAAQSKTETSGAAKGASDAADWAIARSLSALRVAEERGQLKDKKRQDSTQSVGSNGDKSV